MRLIPNGAVIACKYEYSNNSDGSTTQSWTDCNNSSCPQSSANTSKNPPTPSS